MIYLMLKSSRLACGLAKKLVREESVLGAYSGTPL